MRLTFTALLLAVAAFGQPPAPKNLKLLPADENLIPTMRSFTVALGQKCDFCHVQGDLRATKIIQGDRAVYDHYGEGCQCANSRMGRCMLLATPAIGELLSQQRRRKRRSKRGHVAQLKLEAV